ncbi:GNAT family N-acetyltransferase [Robiginitalea sp. IMCC43444]|uniref:GNAT family N-acetyltransferase n=1 Tax=Robiginitalea sp. IMCC43444 TaxID=3459121 RepID=UPI004043767D
MKILVKSFSELSVEELYALLQLRSDIFVVEQQCIYLDLDGIDTKAVHVLGYEGSELAAYTRIFRAGDNMELASIGRVAVQQGYRGQGKGVEIMKASLEAVASEFGEKDVAISAQTYLIEFYEGLGFKKKGDIYLEDDIPHIKMIRTPD